jgi:tetratricopeptide (TPR) repeat protein
VTNERAGSDQPANADRRLRQAVRAFLELPLDPGQPIPPPGPLPAGSRLPFPPNPLFTGREDELRQLARILTGRAGPRAGAPGTGAIICTEDGAGRAAAGLGGQGKSALAQAFAYRYGPYFQGGVFWVSLADPAGVAAEVAACGRAMGLPGFDTLTLPEQVALVRRLWTEPLPRLIIFDGCDDHPAAGLTAEALLDQWRPGGAAGRLLVTTRRGRWHQPAGPAGAPLELLPLAGLARDDSVAFLSRHWPDGLPRHEWRTAGLIAAEAGDLPLALRLAGHYLFEMGAQEPLEWYLARLKEERLAGRSQAGPEWAGPSPTRHDRLAGHILAMTWQQLDPDRPVDAAALVLLARLACLRPGLAVPWPIVGRPAAVDPDRSGLGVALRGLVGGKDDWWTGEGLDEAALNDGRWRLISLGLVTAVDPPPAAHNGVARPSLLILPELVWHYARAMLPDAALDAAGRAVARAAAAEARRLNEEGDRRPALHWPSQLRHLTGLALAGQEAEAAALTHELGMHLYLTGDYDGARPYLERAVALMKGRGAADPRRLAAGLAGLGLVRQALGNLEGARPLLERSLAIRERALGPDDLETAAGLSALGGLLFAQGDYAAARRCHERALAIRERALGKDHLANVPNLNALGAVLQAQGELGAARCYYEWAVLICRGVLGADHPETAAGLARMGRVLQVAGAYDEARPLFEQALAIQERTLGPDHPETAAALNGLAYLLEDIGDYDGARACLERALAILGATFGPDHPQAAAVRDDLVLLNGMMAGYRP